MKTWRTLLLVAAFIACVPFTARADDPVVATINGVDIKQSDLDFAATEVGAQLANFPPDDRRRMLLQFVIENELMAEAAVKAGLDSGQSLRGPPQISSPPHLAGCVFRQERAECRHLRTRPRRSTTAKVAGMKPEEEIHARHILVATEAEAKEIQERLKKGEDFATVAKEKSKDPSAEGGDLGFFGRGQMLKPFEDAAFQLKEGEISNPVQTQFGWHIIKVEEKRTRPLPTFDQVKDTIISQLTQQKAKQTLKDLHDAAKIDVKDPEIKKSMQDAAVRGEAPAENEPEVCRRRRRQSLEAIA